MHGFCASCTVLSAFLTLTCLFISVSVPNTSVFEHVSDAPSSTEWRKEAAFEKPEFGTRRPCGPPEAQSRVELEPLVTSDLVGRMPRVVSPTPENAPSSRRSVRAVTNGVFWGRAPKSSSPWKVPKKDLNGLVGGRAGIRREARGMAGAGSPLSKRDSGCPAEVPPCAIAGCS